MDDVKKLQIGAQKVFNWVRSAAIDGKLFTSSIKSASDNYKLS